MPEPFSVVIFKRRNEQTHQIDTLQAFTLLRVEPHRTKTGEESAVMTWQTRCMDCGKSFTFTSGLSTGNFYRRDKGCRKGKQPGGWPTGPRIRHILERYIDPESLF
jgi:hypothetical protein